MQTKNLIKEIILDYEADKISIEKAIAEISLLTKEEVTPYSINNYWRSISLEDFVKQLSLVEIDDYENLTEEKSIKLISEMLENIVDYSLFEKNSRALEKRYRKSSGQIGTWVFEEDITDPQKIMTLLKEDDVIYL